MKGKRHIAPLFIVLLWVLIPSCGFITVLFDNDGDSDSNISYTIIMTYTYNGGQIIDETSPLFFLLIPLNENKEFEDGSFDQAGLGSSINDTGAVSFSNLQKGPYALLWYIDAQLPQGELNAGEVYSFYNRRDLASSFRYPDYIWVDSSFDGFHLDLWDDFSLQGIEVVVPVEGETLHGENLGGSLHRIFVIGFTFDKTIDTIQFHIDGVSKGGFTPGGENPWIFSINMYGEIAGWHNLEVYGMAGGYTVATDFHGFYYTPPS